MTGRDAMPPHPRFEGERDSARKETISFRQPSGLEDGLELHRSRRLREIRAPRARQPFGIEPPSRNIHEALDAFAWSLEAGRKLTIAFAFDKERTFSLQVGFSVAKSNDRTDLEAAVGDLEDGFEAALAAAGLDCAFAIDADDGAPSWPVEWQSEILPVGIRLGGTGCDDALSNRNLRPRLCVDDFDVLIAQPRLAPPIPIVVLLRSMAAAKCPTRLVINLAARLLRAEELRLIARLRDHVAGWRTFARTDGLPPLTAHEAAEPIAVLLRGFEREGKAVETSIRIEAGAPLPAGTLALAAAAFWGAHQCGGEAAFAERDWRRLLPIGYRLPQWMASRSALEALGVPLRLPPARRVPCQGVLLGHTSDGEEVRLSDRDRERHVYCCGATGSGKSTLLANMVLQDIAAHKGLILIDPHGDIATDVLDRVPTDAMNRVIALDLANPDFAPGLNLCDVRVADPELAKPLVCGELLRIFKNELFADIPEAFGPMFELYFRNAVMLLLEAEGPSTATIIDVPRVFQDDKYRKLLIDCCPNRHVKDFWNETADSVTHDEIALRNIAPYVISKFEPFLGSRAIRTIVGQQTTTLDFDFFMDQGRVVLISLAKGAIGSNEARVLGLLLLQQLQIACLARARRPKQERRPVTLYIDEAQSFIGGALTEMLAEARKFGLSLVLANQTVAQLSGRTSRALIDVLLGNVANVLALRTGIRDAEILAPWFRPHMTVDELIGMPDFSAAGRLLNGRGPGDPVWINLPPLPPAGDPAIAKRILAASRASCCTLRDQVEAKLQAR
jgi:hypothetical protein